MSTASAIDVSQHSVSTERHASNENLLDVRRSARYRLAPEIDAERGESRRRAETSNATNLVDTLRSMVREIVREELASEKPKASDPTGHLSTRAAAQHAGVAMGTIRRWIRDGKLRELRAGRHLRVRRCDIDALLHGERDYTNISPEELARQAFGG